MMPGRYASYPAYSGGQQYPQQLFPYSQYAPAYGWGYPPYAQYPGGVPVPYPGYPPVSPRQRRQERRNMSPPEEVQLHEFLGGRHRPTIMWHVSENMTTAQRIQGRGILERIPQALLSKPATEPPVNQMRIICDDFSWDIVIHPPRNEIVTVEHVLGAIYGVLQEPLDLESWQSETPNVKKHLHRARCGRLARTVASFKVDSHIKKVDILGDKTFFLGLKPLGPPDQPVEWLLKLGLPPKQGRR